VWCGEATTGFAAVAGFTAVVAFGFAVGFGVAFGFAVGFGVTCECATPTPPRPSAATAAAISAALRLRFKISLLSGRLPLPAKQTPLAVKSGLNRSKTRLRVRHRERWNRARPTLGLKPSFGLHSPDS
jgi:hypothetical protein